MDLQPFVEQLFEDPAGQQQLFNQQLPNLGPEQQEVLAEALRQKALHYQRSEIQKAFQAATLILLLAQHNGNPRHLALGLRVKAQAMVIGLGQYQEALPFYDQAIAIHQKQDDDLGLATVHLTRIWALACLGQYQEAITDGHWAESVLQTHHQWRLATNLYMNLALIYERMGQIGEAICKIEQAEQSCRQLGLEGQELLPAILNNKALFLSNTGRFQQAIQVFGQTITLAETLQQSQIVSVARLNLGRVYFNLGEYNRALNFFEQTAPYFLIEGRQRDALLLELSTTDCYLELRRFADVQGKCEVIYQTALNLNLGLEAAQALYNQAIACAGLQQLSQSFYYFQQARQRFLAEGNHFWAAVAELQLAALYFKQQQYQECLSCAERCVAIFTQSGMLIEANQTHLLIAQTLLQLGANQKALSCLTTLITWATQEDVPILLYQGYWLLGQLYRQQQQNDLALTYFEQAITALEQLQGRLMVEYRLTFIEDKQRVYEQIVALHLELGQFDVGLTYAERAKSRILLDMVAHRLDLSVWARAEEDKPLVDELNQLRLERDRLYHQMSQFSGLATRSLKLAGEGEQKQLQILEKRITHLWHRLLLRNGDYGRQAITWQTYLEPFQAYLPAGTLLLEYFTIDERVVLFLTTKEEVLAFDLAVDLGQLQSWQHRLRLNLRSVLGCPAHLLPNLEQNACQILKNLYRLVLQPVTDYVAQFSNLIIVPHGPLHYLPFQALHDGQSYLLEKHELSYLPAASFLRYVSEYVPAGTGALVVGHSFANQLPFAVQEAEQVAALWQVKPLLEGEAKVAEVCNQAAHCRLIHLATHGTFRPDNPLFSGLALADGWLTTFDIFNLRLQASLITLSACETGRTIIGGGDELLGLMRACLSSGTASLVSTLWPVEDSSPGRVMEKFYHNLAIGNPKATSLRTAQLSLLGRPETRHPYFWSPFFLVGDTRPL